VPSLHASRRSRRVPAFRDIVISSVGSERYRITADLVKPGAVVIDVATRVAADGKLHGDVDFEQVKDIASFVTPVAQGSRPGDGGCFDGECCPRSSVRRRITLAWI